MSAVEAISETSPADEVLVSVENLKVHFPVHKGVIRRQVGTIKAVDGVSFDIKRRETLGLVGESGCGKTTTGRAILRLYRVTDGRIVIDGQDITALEGEALRRTRPHMQMVFQDPQACLNPRMTVGSIVAEPIDEHGIVKGREKQDRVEELLSAVGLDRVSPTAIRTSFPAASGSGSASPGPWL